MPDTTNRRKPVTYTVHDDITAGTLTVSWDDGPPVVLDRTGARALGVIADLDAIRSGWR